MTQNNEKRDSSDSQASPEYPSDNLHQIQELQKDNQALEINKQMNSLDDTIDKLGKRLDASNRKIKSDIKRLSQSDTEITEKVSETYRQLGQIESDFLQMGKSSKKISSDIKAINQSIKTYEKNTAIALTQAIDGQTQINSTFKMQHEDLLAQSQKLSKKADTLSRKLSKSIKDNSLALTELEAKIIAELEQVAQSSAQRDSDLDDKIDGTNSEVSRQKAKMLLMQSVDEALDKRANALEKTTKQLLSDSEEIMESVDTLNILTAKLSSDVEALEIYSAQLAAQNEQQQGFIDNLEEKTASMSRTLLSLVTLEKRHFRLLGSVSIVILLALIGLFFYGEYQRDIQLTNSEFRNSIVNQEIASLKNRVEDEQMASQVFYSDITDLQKHIGKLEQELVDVNKQVATINDQVIEMNDQVESIDGRFRYFAPLHNFGSDNTIHGSEWLAKLDKQLHSIKVATVDTQQELYTVASRYNSYLTQDLAYFINEDGRYTLIHGGKYQDENELQQALRDMPSYINYERISVISNAEILELLNKG